MTETDTQTDQEKEREKENMGEREREKERQRERDRETETERQRQRGRDRETERVREREEKKEGKKRRQHVVYPSLSLALVYIPPPVVTVAAVIVLCIMFNRNDSADTALRTTSLQTRVLSHHVRRASNRPTQHSTGSSRSPPLYTFIPVINPGYEIRTSIPAPGGMTGHRTDRNLTSDNQPRNFSQLSSGVRRLNPLYEGVNENEDTV